MKKILTAIFAFSSIMANAQTGAYNEQATAYIRQYKDMAIAEQRRSGVPAAITLAQGIYETQAGQSELATEANNHFGIKCKKEWTGETFAHTDDAPNECFRKYSNANDSYRDHSDYLRKSPRYASCFALQSTDYVGWATELKKCGYATNPKYASKLVRVVEDFHLQDYTNEALQIPVKDVPVSTGAVVPVKEQVIAAATPIIEEAKPVAGENIPDQEVTPAREEMKAEVAPVVPVQEMIESETAPVYGQQTQRYGLKGFYAHKGDVMLEYAIKYNLRYARLLELNDLPDAPLSADMFVYLEKKRGSGMHSTHKVMPGETMLTIAQAEGIQLKQLRTLNQMEQGEEPNAGIALQLQNVAAAKPSVASNMPPDVVPQYQATITKPEPVAVVREEAPASVPVTQVEEKAVAMNTPVATTIPVIAEEEEEKEELPAVPLKPVIVAKVEGPIQTQQPVIIKPEEPKKQEPVRRAEPIAPRPQPKPTPPRVKTYTIADEKAVGEENPSNVKYSPRYVPPKEDTPAPAVETPSQNNTNSNTNTITPPPPPKAAEPQDEFSKLKAQLDKAVYAPRKPATMVVTEESPEALRGRVPAQSTTTATVAPQVISGNIGTHTVKNGETAFSIAKQYGMSMKELREMNNLNFEAIKVGQKLKVRAN